MFRSYSFNVATSPVITVQGSARPAEKWLDGYIRPFRDLCSLATHRPQQISWVQLSHQTVDSERDRKAQLFGSEVQQAPFDATSPDRPIAPLFRFGPENESLPRVLDAWKEARQAYKTFFDLLTLGIYEQLPARSALLVAIPALESYHGTRYGNGRVSVTEHRAQRSAIFERLKEANVSTEDRKWLKGWVDSRGGFPLHERLTGILEGTRPSLRERIAAAVSAPLPQFASLRTADEDVWHAVARLRNDLAHGGPDPSEAAVMTALRLTQTLSTVVLLDLLGLSDEGLTSLMDAGSWQIV